MMVWVAQEGIEIRPDRDQGELWDVAPITSIQFRYKCLCGIRGASAVFPNKYVHFSK